MTEKKIPTNEEILEKWKKLNPIISCPRGFMSVWVRKKHLFHLISLARDAALEEADAKLKAILSEVKELLILSPEHNGKPSRLWSGAEKYLEISISEIHALRAGDKKEGR
jgi:hypothetical protein